MNFNAAIDGGLVFPILGYQKTLKDVPSITMEEIKRFYQSKSTTLQHYRRSYKFLIEEYIISDSLMSKAELANDRVFVKGLCFKSQKKNDKPYTVCAALKISNAEILDEYCGCPAGISGTCNHGVALLRLLTLLRNKKIHYPPNELSCTDKPQQWNRPRGKKIQPFSVMDLNVQAPKEGSNNKPVLCKMYEASSSSQEQTEVSEATKNLINDLNVNGVDGWASILPPPEEYTWIETRMGYAPEGSALSLQLSANEYGFEVIHNFQNCDPSLLFCREYLPSDRFPIPTHSCNSTPWCQKNLKEKYGSSELAVLMKNEVSIDQARNLEANTRNQADSPLWKEARKTRLSSSNFGLVCKRKNQKWTQIGIKNLVNPKDIGHLKPIKYGKQYESIAKNKYCKTMHSLGHYVTIHGSGYIVDPRKPWLGTSPDGLVHDPKEPDPFGLLEIKCPWSKRDKKPSEVLGEDDRIKMVAEKPLLNENDNHYYQIMGQMALSGLKWCDYVTYFPAGLIIVRVHFNQEKWDRMQSILKAFYFTHMLPNLAKLTIRKNVIM